eukprot:4304874-Pyramimonas_sp.AAC.1
MRRTMNKNEVSSRPSILDAAAHLLERLHPLRRDSDRGCADASDPLARFLDAVHLLLALLGDLWLALRFNSTDSQVPGASEVHPWTTFQD